MLRTSKMLRVSQSMVSRIWLLGLLILLSSIQLREALGDVRPTRPDIGPNTVELFSYQASGYRFQIIPLGSKPPSGFAQPDFDDTDFSMGSGGFGSGGSCPLQRTVQTNWPIKTQLLIRREISVPDGAAGLRIMVSVDNDVVALFFNGTRIAANVRHDFCPILDQFRFDVPQELVRPGQNLVALQVLDRGVESFFDTRLLAELPVPVDPGLATLVALQNMPIQDLSLPEAEKGESTYRNVRLQMIVEGQTEGVDSVKIVDLLMNAQGKVVTAQSRDPVVVS